jgi:hypothetical protein
MGRMYERLRKLDADQSCYTSYDGVQCLSTGCLDALGVSCYPINTFHVI